MPYKPEPKRNQIKPKLAKNTWNGTGFSYSDSAWIKIREERKRLNPLCEKCLEIGILTVWKWKESVIDHKMPVRTHPDLAYDLDNTQHLCKEHHNQKTGKESRK